MKKQPKPKTKPEAKHEEPKPIIPQDMSFTEVMKRLIRVKPEEIKAK